MKRDEKKRTGFVGLLSLKDRLASPHVEFGNKNPFLLFFSYDIMLNAGKIPPKKAVASWMLHM
jgi:hypothetical protein